MRLAHTSCFGSLLAPGSAGNLLLRLVRKLAAMLWYWSSFSAASKLVSSYGHRLSPVTAFLPWSGLCCWKVACPVASLTLAGG